MGRERTLRNRSGLRRTRCSHRKGGCMTMRKISLCAVASALLLSASLALGQASTGNIYGRVMDEQGGVLPGVSLTASGPGASQTTFTDPKGVFFFLNRSVGSTLFPDAPLC